MRMVKSLLLSSAAGVVAVAGAQAADMPVKAKPVEYVKICSLYGDGFFYLPGTQTCIRLGGSVQSDNYYNAAGNGQPLYQGAAGAHDRSTSEHAMRGRIDLGLNSRTQTPYGTLRVIGADERKNLPLTNLSTAGVVTVGNAPTTSRSGMNWPDPYVAFRMSQAWGGFTSSIHANTNNALYYTAVTPGFPACLGT